MVIVQASPDPGLHPRGDDRRRLAALVERAGRLLGGRRRVFLPLPINCCLAKTPENLGEKRVECTILEEIVKSALLNLHSVERSLKYWELKTEETQSRRMYFMAFERGPKAFVKIACRTLCEIRNPSKFLEDSVSDLNHMITARMDTLTKLQQCLANFLTQVFFEVEASREGLDEKSLNPLRAMFIVVNTLFQKLGFMLKTVIDEDTDFERLHLPDVESAKWTIDSSLDAISVVYHNIKKFNKAVSFALELHGKPNNFSIYWLPYTFGTAAFVGCSIWLLRNSSVEDGYGIDSWFQGAKQTLSRVLKTHVKKPIVAIRDELKDSFHETDHLEKRRHEVQMLKKSVDRSLKTFLKNSSSSDASSLSEDEQFELLLKTRENQLSGTGYGSNFWDTIKMVIDPDLYRAIFIKIDRHSLRFELELLGISETIKRMGLNIAIFEALPLVSVFALLIWLLRAHGRGAVHSRQIATRLLIAKIEKDIKEFEKFLSNGMKYDGHCEFGMMLYKLENLWSTIEPHAKTLAEWECVRDDLINLARPMALPDERSLILSRLKWTYQSTRVI